MKSKGLKAVIILIGAALLVFLLYQSFGTMLPGLIQVLKSGSEKEIAEYLNEAGRWDGLLCTVLLQFIQVVSIVLPGMPIQIAAGMVYGAWRAFLVTYFGYVAANVVVFAAARRVGSHVTDNLPSKMKNNWLLNKFNTIRPEFVVAMACLMPGVPNGIVPYIAAGTQITYKDFTIAVAAGSGVPILLSCLTGHFLLNGDYTFSVISIVLLWVLIITVFKNQDRIFKRLDALKDSKSVSTKENN